MELSNFTNWLAEKTIEEIGLAHFTVAECPICKHPVLMVACEIAGEYFVITQNMGRLCLSCGTYLEKFETIEKGFRELK